MVTCARATTLVASCLAVLATGEATPREQSSQEKVSKFTALTSIELPSVRKLDGYEDAGAPGEVALFSADSSRFALVTRRGDVSRDVNVETILFYRTDDVERFIRGTHSTPETVSIERNVIRDAGRMRALQWIDEARFGFIGEAIEGSNQAFLVDARTGRVAQLTNAKADVAAFSVGGGSLVYFAHTTAPEPNVVPINAQGLTQILFPNESPEYRPVQLHYASTEPGAARAIDGSVVALTTAFQRIWVSPSGNYAVTFTPAVSAPAHWAEYQLAGSYRYTADKVRADPTSWDLMDRTRYQLVDLRSGTVRPLLDAPSGALAFNATPPVVLWPDGDNAVVVSNTFLPLTISDEHERKRRRSAPAIAEIRLSDGAPTAILFEPTNQDSARITSIDWDDRSRSLAVTMRLGDGVVATKRYTRTSTSWRASPGAATERVPSLKVKVVESFDQRPKVYATSPICSCSKLLLDPAPEADRFDAGRRRIVQWVDKNGFRWRGGLIEPRAVRGKWPLPLVVQTHGFSADEYLLDGPGGTTTAMAAQALVGEGIAVLQVEDKPLVAGRDEAAEYAEGYRAGIEKLVDDGIADPNRVGLVAFSRTCLPAVKLVADQPNLLSAVNFADATWWGYLARYLLMVDAPQDVATQVQKATGNSFDVSRPSEWFNTDPVYKLSSSKTAIRLEPIGPSSLLAAWETYALLRTARHAVDVVYIPRGSHNLIRPSERLASQGGTVDWFKFWLKGEEDTASEKTEQYKRWRRLRANHCERLATDPDPPWYCREKAVSRRHR